MSESGGERVSPWLDLGGRIAAREASRPSGAYHRLVRAIENGAERLTLPDRDLLAAAKYAVRRDELPTALVALNELELRLASDEPGESIERAA